MKEDKLYKNRIKIFIGEQDNTPYNNIDAYAFLNWRFDDGYGSNDKNNPKQMIRDNYQLGKAYLGNSLIVLNVIIKSNNIYSAADILIFPVLFSLWHGVELWLKCCIRALELSFSIIDSDRPNHNIVDYYEKLNSILNEKNLMIIAENGLTGLFDLMEEMKRVNANFDFARYSFDSHGDYQFFNASYKDCNQWQHLPGTPILKDKNVIPNTRVDIFATYELGCQILELFGSTVEYFVSSLEHNLEITNEGFEHWINVGEKLKEDRVDEDTSVLNRILRMMT